MAKSQVKILVTAKDQTKQAFNSVNSRMSSLKKASSALTQVLGPLAVGVSAVGFVQMAKDSLKAADEIQKMSKRLDISTEALSQYRHVADLSGTSFEVLAKGVAKSQRTIADAEDGLSTAVRAIQDMGLSVAELKGLKPEDAFERMGAAMAAIEDPYTRASVAANVFGRAGKEMLPIFEGGAENIRAMREEADRLGLTLDQVSADKAAAAVDAMTRIDNAVKGLQQTLAVGIAPGLTATLDNFIQGLDDRQKRLDQTVHLKFEHEYLQKKFPDMGWKERRDLARANVEAGTDALSRVEEANRLFADSLNAIPDPANYPAFGEFASQADSLANSLETLQAKAESLDIDIMKVVTGDDGSLRFEYKTLEDLTKDVNKKLVEIWTSDPPVIPKVTIAAPESLKDEVGLILAEFDALPPVPIKTYLAAPDAAPEDLLFDFGEVGKAGQDTMDDLDDAAEDAARGITSSISSAALASIDALEGLGSVGRSIFGSIISTAISFGTGKFLDFAFRASGGPVGAGKAYVVGEEGPELFIPSTSGAVIPNGKSAGTAGGGAAATVGDVHVHLNGIWDMTDPLTSRRIGQRVYDEIRVLQTQHGPQGAAK